MTLSIIYHPTTNLADFIAEMELCEHYCTNIAASSLIVTVLPTFLAIELVFKQLPLYLGLQFYGNVDLIDECSKKIQKLTKGIFSSFLMVSDPLRSAMQFMSFHGQQKVIEFNGLTLELASEEIKNNTHIVRNAVRQNGLALLYASDSLKNNKDIVRESVIQNYESFQYASSNLRDDKEFVMDIILINASALKYVSHNLKNDRAVVASAVSRSLRSWYFAAEELENDKAFVIEMLNLSWGIFFYLSDDLMNDQDIVLEAIKHCYIAFELASDDLKNNESFILKALKFSYNAFQYVATPLKSNKSFALAALLVDVRVFPFISEELKTDKEFIIEAIVLDIPIEHYLSATLLHDRQFILELVKQKVQLFPCLILSFKNDPKIALEAIRQIPHYINELSVDLRHDREFVLNAVKINGQVYYHISDHLKNDVEILLTFIYTQLPLSICSIDGKRYFPKALTPGLKQLTLPELLPNFSLDHLEADLTNFIDNLQEGSQSIIASELGLNDLNLIQLKDVLISYKNLLFSRVRGRIAYFGTPPVGSLELIKFYQHIEEKLVYLDGFFSKDINQMPSATIERLQLLQTQKACGARFQAEIEQLFFSYCFTNEAMHLDKQMAMIASSCARTAIVAMAQNADVHDVNILSWQLDAYLVGNQVARDHLADLKDEIPLIISFLVKHTSVNLVDHVQRLLKPGSELEGLFSSYIKEQFALTLSSEDQEIVHRLAINRLQDFIRYKVQKFQEYKLAVYGQGLFGSIQNNIKLLEIFGLNEDESKCRSDIELLEHLEVLKDKLEQIFYKEALDDCIIEKIYELYFDLVQNQWKSSIIAMALEKMGVLQEL